MSVEYGMDRRQVNAMTRFMNKSRQLNTQLNKTPRVKTDFFDNPRLNKSPRGLAHGQPTDARLNAKPLAIRKKASGQSQSTKFKGEHGHKLPPRNKGMVERYK